MRIASSGAPQALSFLRSALIDSNNDGLIDAVVVTLTDNGIGDDDVTVNGVISLHGMLGWYGV